MKPNQEPVSAYDEVAAMYHSMWADWYLPAALPALEQLFFSRVAGGVRVLDVCCGSGHVTKELVRRGYQVMGVDSSAGLVAIAQAALPSARFRVQDVRTLRLGGRFEAALSTFDSLNHMMTFEDLRSAFVGVHDALEPGGLFVFDMNLASAYEADLSQWHVSVSDTSVGLVRGTFDFETKRAATELIWMVRDGGRGCWQRHDSTVVERCYSEGEILAALYSAGFREAKSTQAIAAGMDPTIGYGRIFFTARP